MRDLEPPGANAAPDLLRGHRPGQRTAAGRMEVVFLIRKLAIANIAARPVWVHPLMRLCLDAGRRDSGLADFRTAVSDDEHIAAPGLRGSDVGGDRRPDADLSGDVRGLGRADHQHHQRSRRRIPEGGVHIIFRGATLTTVIGFLPTAGRPGALQTAMIIGALPFSFLLALMGVAMVKALIRDSMRSKVGQSAV